MFQHLADGPQLVKALELRTKLMELRPAARQGSRTAQQTIEQIEANPLFMEWLPQLGYRDLPHRGWHYDPCLENELWALHSYLPTELKNAATSTRMPERVIQTMPAAEIRAAWQRARTHRADPATVEPYAAVTLAAILAQQGGPLWVYDAATDTLVRDIPPWPVSVPRPEPHKGHVIYGTNVVEMDVHAWVYERADQDRLVFASAALSHSRLKQATTMLRVSSKKKAAFQFPTQGRSVRVGSGDAAYDLLSQPVAGTDLHHWVISHPQIVSDLRCGAPVYHITGSDGIPMWDLLAAQLNGGLLLPFERERLPDIWAVALQEGLVERLPAYQCTGYKVVTDQYARWTQVLAGLYGHAGVLHHHTESADSDDLLDDGSVIEDDE